LCGDVEEAQARFALHRSRKVGCRNDSFLGGDAPGRRQVSASSVSKEEKKTQQDTHRDQTLNLRSHNSQHHRREKNTPTSPKNVKWKKEKYLRPSKIETPPLPKKRLRGMKKKKGFLDSGWLGQHGYVGVVVSFWRGDGARRGVGGGR